MRAPVLGPAVVPRSGLVKDLLDTEPGEVVVITAPAGYGKTTTMALWDDADSRPFAWVNLDHLDRDPAHLVRHVAAAVRRVGDVDVELLRYLEGPGRSSDLLVPGLLELLEQVHRPWVLVVDDCQILDRLPSADVLAEVVAGRPADVVVALVGRTAPAVGLARVRMTGRLLERGPAQLALSADEAREVFAELDVAIDEDRLADVVERSEGWVGGVHLAALALREPSSRPDAPVLTGRHRLVADYLVEQVLATLDPDTTAFLEESSVLDRMNADVLDEVLGRHDSGTVLRRIEASGNLFLVPLDEERRWYRFHHLLGDLLRARLDDRAPGRARSLHARAAGVAERVGDLDTAVRHAVASGDGRRAAAMVQRDAVELAWGGRGDVLRRRLDWLDEPARTRTADGALAEAWSALAWGDGAAARAALVAAAAADDGTPPGDGTASVPVAIALVQALLGDDGLDGIVRNTEIVRASAGPLQGPWWGLATGVQGTAMSHMGRWPEARRLLREAAVALGNLPGAQAVCHAHLALVDLEAGDRAAALGHSDDARRIADRHDLRDLVPVLILYAVDALVAARAGLAERAWEDIRVARRSLARLGEVSPRTGISAHILLARAHLVLQDGSGARAEARSAARLYRDAPVSEELGRQLAELERVLATGPSGSKLAVTPLTEAELRVLPHLTTHLSLRQIATVLHLSRNTVKTHCVAIYRKLGVSSRDDAVAESRRLGLLDD